MKEKKKSAIYDIVVVGAGLVGLSVILALKETGLRIAVLEKHLPRVITPDNQDQRPLTLSYGSQMCLERWGVWSSLADQAMPVQSLHVSEQGRLGRLQLTAEEARVPALGYVVPFSALQSVLFESVSTKESEVNFISIEEILSIQCDVDGARLEYVAADEAQAIQATLLIAADGAHSHCRDLLGVATQHDQTNDLALIATLDMKEAHHSIAYQRVTAQGSLALLPLFNSHQYRLVWTMKSAVYEEIKDWSDDVLLAHIKSAYGGRLDTLCAIHREAVFPLETIIAEEMVRPSMVLLGNAAHTIYPVAAQGFNLSVHDVAALSRVLTRAIQDKESIGALSTLERYLDRRQASQQSVIQWTERIANVFHWRIPVLDHVRGLALLSADMVPFVKTHFSEVFLHG